MTNIELIINAVPLDKWPTKSTKINENGFFVPDDSFPKLPDGMRWDKITCMPDWIVFDERGWPIANIKTCYPEAKFIGEL